MNLAILKLLKLKLLKILGAVLKKTVPSGEFLGCLHCAAGQCKGSLGIFLGQTLGFKTSGAVPPRFCSLGLAQMPQGPSHGPLAQCEHP